MPLTRPVAGDPVTVEDFGQPVYDLVAPTEWVTMTLQNGWTAFGGSYQPPQYRRVGQMVQLAGAVKNSVAITSPGQSQIAVLPSGYRPVFNIITVCIFGGGDGWGGMGRLDINATGGLLLTASGGMTGAHTISAFNVQFSIV